MKRIGVVADDLTGAADTGVQFAKMGFNTLLFSPDFRKGIEDIDEKENEQLDTISVLVINTRSRGIAPQEAHTAVHRAFTLLHKRDVFYKKVDSTLRGNVGAEVDAALEATNSKIAVFSAAFPEQKRYTIGGIHFVDKLPLQYTEFSNDPVMPVKTSFVADLIREGTEKKVAIIDITRIAAGEETLSRSINEYRELGFRILACDAVVRGDLDTIGNTTLRMETIPLLCGSAGLAQTLAQRMSQDGSVHVGRNPEKREKKDTGEKILVISGSTSEVTSCQLEYLGKMGKVGSYTLSMEAVSEGDNKDKGWLKRIAGHILSKMNDTRVLVIRSELPPYRGEKGKGTFSEEIAMVLGNLCEMVLKNNRNQFKGLVLTGGDTADAVIRRLGAAGLSIRSEVQAGIPFGQLFGGDFSGFPVITKAGAFGETNSLVECVNFF